MKLDPQKPPPWKTPGFLPLMLLMMLGSALLLARNGTRRDVVFGEATSRGAGLGDVPFRPRATPSASASALPVTSGSAVPPVPSASAGR